MKLGRALIRSCTRVERSETRVGVSRTWNRCEQRKCLIHRLGSLSDSSFGIPADRSKNKPPRRKSDGFCRRLLRNAQRRGQDDAGVNNLCTFPWKLHRNGFRHIASCLKLTLRGGREIKSIRTCSIPASLSHKTNR